MKLQAFINWSLFKIYPLFQVKGLLIGKNNT